MITLQNPHGLPPASVANPSAVVKTTKSGPVKPEPSRTVAALKVKEAVPCMFFSLSACFVILKTNITGNISPYSSGMAGASLTSTSVDISEASSSKLLWDEVCAIQTCLREYMNSPRLQEEIMFEYISKPLKGKGKEKDVGKRRAYVRVVTSLGGASLNLELYCEKVNHHLYCGLEICSQSY